MSSRHPTKTHGNLPQLSGVASPPPRARILSAAKEMFYQQGINAVGVEAIAEAALTNKMTLYRHFKSKDELIVAYVSEIAQEGDAVWEGLKAQYSWKPDEFLNAWVDYVEEILNGKAERGCALANAAVELPAEHPARAVIEAYKGRKRQRLVELFAAARYMEPERLADEVFLVFEGARIAIQCGGKIPAARVTKMLRDLFAKSPRTAFARM